MKYMIYDRLLHRQLGSREPYCQSGGIYGDRCWIDDLDIVNELGGHTGCVNALSWSRSGALLASGSDDTHVNLHAYLPESSNQQFALSAKIATGHSQNIFSVKFMPHCNDGVIVSAAGDGEVRIFDIEYAAQSTTSAVELIPFQRTSLQRRPKQRHGATTRFISEGDSESSAKVFRSHGDRVKRIVTESSPYYFLTCSEDGEVRQWDIRQPAEAYPSPRSFSNEYDVPRPLISYKRHQIELNTISCSASQPHYIALGGAHLHCFLHDRRMLGRDRTGEKGQPASSPGSSSAEDERHLEESTQCVRRFAPEGKTSMKPRDNGHITACKISDYNPNELIVSWSGDFIYNFDIAQSPDATNTQQQPAAPADPSSGSPQRVKDHSHRKRKRQLTGSHMSQDDHEGGGSRARTRRGVSADSREEMALMVQYENGQSEEIPIERSRSRSPASQAHEAMMSDTERDAYLMAKTVLQLRKRMFTLSERGVTTSSEPTAYTANFTSCLGYAVEVLPQIDEVMRSWRYPVNPHPIDVALQNRLRDNRDASRRFVQAAGTLARVLGGKLQTAGNDSGFLLEPFIQIITRSTNRRATQTPDFSYDFLKAILLWLDSGIGALLQGFSAPGDTAVRHSSANSRYPIPPDADSDAVDDFLIPYLLQSASDRPIPNVDSSRFEVDENCVAFETEKAAVLAFAQALKMPFEDLSSAVVHSTGEGSSGNGEPTTQDRHTAIRFWAFKVGRGVLMNAGEKINFALVDHAFGGLGRPDDSIRADEKSLTARTTRIDPDEEDQVIESARLVQVSSSRGPGGDAEGADAGDATEVDSEPGSEGIVVPMSDLRDVIGANEEFYNSGSEEDAEGDDDDDAEVDEEDSENRDSEDDEESDSAANILFASADRRRGMRSRVQADVPCSSHIRTYRGHCNVRTVKDVNFFGQQDEYVVSGSDSGHVFIWDKKTSQLVNILEGDGEVVNVIQGHPTEPMMAVSGIDHTIKIFSADARDRDNARRGIGVKPADPSSFPSIRHGRARRPRPQRAARSNQQQQQQQQQQQSHASSSSSDALEADEEEDALLAPDGLESRKRMHKEYEITSQNDEDRRGGGREAYVTRGLLMQLAQQLRHRQGGADADAVNLDDCRTM